MGHSSRWYILVPLLLREPNSSGLGCRSVSYVTAQWRFSMQDRPSRCRNSLVTFSWHPLCSTVLHKSFLYIYIYRGIFQSQSHQKPIKNKLASKGNIFSGQKTGEKPEVLVTFHSANIFYFTLPEPYNMNVIYVVSLKRYRHIQAVECKVNIFPSRQQNKPCCFVAGMYLGILKCAEIATTRPWNNNN